MSVNFTGGWTADLGQSRFLAATPKAISAKINQSDDELREELIVTRPDGTKERALFTYRINGESETLLDGRSVRSRAKWQGRELIIESWTQSDGRETYFCDCWSLSSDGQTLSMEHRNDVLAGQLTILKRVR